MKQFLLVMVMSLFLLGCNSDDKKANPGEALNGKWVSPMMTAEIDTKAGTYKVVALGKESTHKLEIVSEKSGVITFKSDENTIIATVNADGSITLGKEGGIPVKMVKQD